MDRKIIKKMLIVIFSMVALVIMLQTNVKAAGIKAENTTGSLRGVSAENFWKIIRGMQSLTGTLGVSQSSNNINCHMAKNTEWGSAAILSASRYGTIPTTNDATMTSSTTGNYTGVFQMNGGDEYVAGVLDGKVPLGIENKYVNKYTTATSSAISGDALTTATGRAVSGTGDWINDSYPWMTRSWYLIFNFVLGNGASGTYGSRAVVVCGSEL